MTIEELVKKAELLPEAETTAIQEYEKNIDTLVAGINEEMLNRADINELVGEKNIEMMKNNHSNHARFVVSILTAPNAQQLVDTVAWVFRSYMNRGFHANYWAAQLNSWISVMKKNLSEESYKEIYPLYDWFIVNIPSFNDLVFKNSLDS